LVCCALEGHKGAQATAKQLKWVFAFLL